MRDIADARFQIEEAATGAETPGRAVSTEPHAEKPRKAEPLAR